MALKTGRCNVFSGEWERGLRCVIEHRSRPIGRGVAQGAIQRETGRCMVGIIRALIILQVTRVASGRKAFVDSAGMALKTRRRDVLSG